MNRESAISAVVKDHTAMMNRLYGLEEQYPFLRVHTLGYSVGGRGIPMIRLGEERSGRTVVYVGTHHGTDRITAAVLLCFLEDYCSSLQEKRRLYSINMEYLFRSRLLCIIPMVNPDGVTTVLTRQLSELQLQIYKRDKELGYMNFDLDEYAEDWKANALGVDLNRNFDARWDLVVYKDEPSYMRYGGTEPFSAAEARAMRDYTLSYDFDATFSYHSTGSVIFWEFGPNKEVNALSKDLGKAVKEVTGYPLEGADDLDSGGYKDWAMDKLGIPSLTIEIGTTRPVNLNREVHSLFYRHYNVFAAAALWVQR